MLLLKIFAETFSCPYATRKCKSGQCVPEQHWCDFVRDCPDFSDEEECGEYNCCLVTVTAAAHHE